MNDKKIPTILVIGAGPAGLTFAHGIQKHYNKNEKKFNIKIFERDQLPQDRWQGSYVVLRPQGLQSLLECIPEDIDLRTIMPDPPTSESHELVLADEIGDPIIKFPSNHVKNVYEFGKLSKYDYFSVMLIYRDKLRDLLIEGLENIGIKINWGKKCVGYEESGDGVFAIFDDGSREYGDILVAADGINSQIRKQKYPELKVKPIGLNYVMTHIAPPKSLVDRFLKIVNKSVVTNSASSNGESMLVFFRSIPTLSATANKEPCYSMTMSYDYNAARDTSAKRIYNEEEHGDILVDENESPEDIVEDVKKMISESRPSCELTDILLEMWSLAPISSNDKRPLKAVFPPQRRAMRDLDPNDVKKWSTSRVTFIGDSVHACTQYLGVGLNIALQDADDLSKSFMNWDKDGWKTCIENYEKKMKQRGSLFVRLSRKDALFEHSIFKTGFGWWCHKSFLKFVAVILGWVYWGLYFKKDL